MRAPPTAGDGNVVAAVRGDDSLRQSPSARLMTSLTRRVGSPWSSLWPRKTKGAVGSTELVTAPPAASPRSNRDSWPPVGAGDRRRSGRTCTARPCTAQHRATGDLLTRTNHRGQPVSLLAGPALATVGAVTAYAGARRSPVGRAALLLGVAAGALGAYDDIVGSRPDQRGDKGLRGHLAALRQGRISSGR